MRQCVRGRTDNKARLLRWVWDSPEKTVCQMSLSLSLRCYVSSDAISPSGPSPSRSRAQLVPGCRLHKAVMTTEHVNARGFTDVVKCSATLQCMQFRSMQLPSLLHSNDLRKSPRVTCSAGSRMWPAGGGECPQKVVMGFISEVKIILGDAFPPHPSGFDVCDAR